jgi:2-polyprenyl-3-methyl-5-hydroxy-6-metoxy-1,4-benzoquinol methylase
MTAVEATIDEAKVGELNGRLFMALLASAELTTVHLGVELGLYAALHEHGPATSTELADRAGVAERYAREWLEQQASADLLTVAEPSPDGLTRRYAISPEAAIVLLDKDHPAYAAAFAATTAATGRVLDDLMRAMRTGGGVAYADYGFHDAQAGFTRPMFVNSLASEWIPALPDVEAKLRSGNARVLDVGCGEGYSSVAFAEAFPGVTVDGIDLDQASIEHARRHAAERGVSDRVEFHQADASGSPIGRLAAGGYDLVTAFEMLHDTSDPVGVLRLMRGSCAPGGTVLVVDELAAEEFEAPADELQRAFYAFSVLHCLPVGMAEQPSAGTGTVMRPSTVRAYAEEAGFANVEVLPIEHEMFRFYRLHVGS